MIIRNELGEIVNPNSHYELIPKKSMNRSRDIFHEHYRDFFQGINLREFLRSEPKILELGCGTGKVLEEFAKTGAVCYGVDLKRFSGTPNFNLVIANIETLPFRDNTFDLVFSMWVLPYVIEKLKVLEETYRVLKPGGRAIVHIGDNIKPGIFTLVRENNLEQQIRLLTTSPATPNTVSITKNNGSRIRFPEVKDVIRYYGGEVFSRY